MGTLFVGVCAHTSTSGRPVRNEPATNDDSKRHLSEDLLIFKVILGIN